MKIFPTMYVVRRIEAYHKVTLDKIKLASESFLFGVVTSTFNLVVIVIQSCDMATSEFGNFTSRTADATANVEDLHTLLDPDAVR